MSLRCICTKIGVATTWLAPVMVGSLLSTAAFAGGGVDDECTTPPPGASDCHEVTKAAGGCTDADCCAAVCAIEIGCCDDFWGLDCVTEASTNPACAIKFPCPQVTCPVGGALEISSTTPGTCEIPAVPEDDVTGGCNAVPPSFQDIACGATVCGTVWIDEVTLAARDTDWYRFTITTRSRVTWTVNAEFASRAFIIRDPGAECGADPGDAAVVVSAGTHVDDPCPNTAKACLDPGTYYAFVAPRFSDPALGEAPFETDCTSEDNDYTATLACTTGSPLCTIDPCSGGALTLTQSASQTMVVGSVACVAAGQTADNTFARSFNLAVGPTAGQAIQIKCVEVGIENNTGDSLTGTVRIHRDTNGGAPALADLVLLGSDDVVIPAGTNLQFIRANFSPAVAPPAGSTILVEFFYPDTVDAGIDPAGGIWPGSNAEGQTGPTYILSDPCGIADYTDLASIEFPDIHFVMNVKYDVGAPCPADFNGSGCVSGVDLATLLGQWSGAALYVPCPPFKAQDLNQDCRVNGLDLALLLGTFGLCPGQAPPCIP